MSIIKQEIDDVDDKYVEVDDGHDFTNLRPSPYVYRPFMPEMQLDYEFPGGQFAIVAISCSNWRKKDFGLQVKTNLREFVPEY